MSPLEPPQRRPPGPPVDEPNAEVLVYTDHLGCESGSESPCAQVRAAAGRPGTLTSALAAHPDGPTSVDGQEPPLGLRGACHAHLGTTGPGPACLGASGTAGQVPFAGSPRAAGQGAGRAGGGDGPGRARRGRDPRGQCGRGIWLRPGWAQDLRRGGVGRKFLWFPSRRAHLPGTACVSQPPGSSSSICPPSRG